MAGEAAAGDTISLVLLGEVPNDDEQRLVVTVVVASGGGEGDSGGCGGGRDKESENE